MKELNLKSINEAYIRLIEQQELVEEELDYSILEHHKPNLQKLAEIGNSTISVFDFLHKKHAFYSSNMGTILGYSPEEQEADQEHFWDPKIHPEDFVMLSYNALSIMKLFFNFSTDEKLNYKLVSEYRILNAANSYVRVIEQHQVLELDNSGKLWLALSILDISPNQTNLNEGLKSELLNFKTGRLTAFSEQNEEISTALTKREIEVLRLVKEGFLSKEISDKLSISLNTVNTYRQRVLEKLGVNNSMEAVMLASKLGLI